MDPADLDEVPEPDSKTQGLNLSPRLNFVPPPEDSNPRQREHPSPGDRPGHRCLDRAWDLHPAGDPLWRHQLVERALPDQDQRSPVAHGDGPVAGVHDLDGGQARGLDRQACQGTPRRHGGRGP